MSAVHTVVVGETRPVRQPAGRGEDGATIWRDRIDVTATDVRCVECDQVVGDITDWLAHQRLNVYWLPSPYKTISLGSGSYIVRDDDVVGLWVIDGLKKSAGAWTLNGIAREFGKGYPDGRKLGLSQSDRQAAQAKGCLV